MVLDNRMRNADGIVLAGVCKFTRLMSSRRPCRATCLSALQDGSDVLALGVVVAAVGEGVASQRAAPQVEEVSAEGDDLAQQARINIS